MATKLQRDVREFLELLISHRVEYLLVGGYADSYPRAANDLDVCKGRTPENARRRVKTSGRHRDLEDLP